MRVKSLDRNHALLSECSEDAGEESAIQHSHYFSMVLRCELSKATVFVGAVRSLGS